MSRDVTFLAIVSCDRQKPRPTRGFLTWGFPTTNLPNGRSSPVFPWKNSRPHSATPPLTREIHF